MTSKISLENFEKLKKNYQYVSSWCVWDKWDDDDPKYTSNLSAANMLWSQDDNLINILKNECVFVAFNTSGKQEDFNPDTSAKTPWDNFHSGRCDYNLRYALWDTEYYGSYITDLIKYRDVKNKIPFKDSSAKKVLEEIKANSELEKDNVDLLKHELQLLGSVNTLIALDSEIYDILLKYKEYLGVHKIAKIHHYSASSIMRDYHNKFGQKDDEKQAVCYKELVLSQLKDQLAK